LNSRKVVTLLEILRCYAEAYAEGSYCLGMLLAQVQVHFDKKTDIRADTLLLNRMLVHLRSLASHCERLPMTRLATLELTGHIENPSKLASWTQTESTFLNCLADIQGRLKDELSLNLFFSLPQRMKEIFDEPFKGWESIMQRFTAVTRDVEEMNKCFALCRYTAAMYHAIQIAEGGAIELGNYIGVTDHRKGWGPTERGLRELIKAGHNKLPPALTGKFAFLEQMHREIDSMVLAWRNKIDHAADRLSILPNTDFTPDIAEHIMGAVRIFMLRLMEGLPK
jgi:hypothetical protein